MDFEQARKNMIECQLRPNQVTSVALLRAFGSLRREVFVPPELQNLAYVDEQLKLGIGENRYLLAPQTSARLLQALNLGKSDSVLVVACAGGYEVALAAQLADMVIGLENDDEFIARANVNLARADIANAEIASGKPTQGVPEEAPFDAIFINGGVARLPQNLCQQMSDGGRLVYVHLNENKPIGEARLITRQGEHFAERILFDAYAEPLKDFAPVKEFVF